VAETDEFARKRQQLEQLKTDLASAVVNWPIQIAVKITIARFIAPSPLNEVACATLYLRGHDPTPPSMLRKTRDVRRCSVRCS
jgi:hypothetical protein